MFSSVLIVSMVLTICIAASVSSTNGAASKSSPPHLPSPPAHIFQFELADAAIPNKETEETIQKGRARSLQQREPLPAATVTSSSSAAAVRPSTSTTSRPPRPTTMSPRQQRRGRAPIMTRHSHPKGDMATEESRTVQIRMPASGSNNNIAGKSMKFASDYPAEVRDVISYVLKKTPIKSDTMAVYKVPVSGHQRYAKNNHNSHHAAPPHQQQPWWNSMQSHPQNAPSITYVAQQYVPDMAYNTIQSSQPSSHINQPYPYVHSTVDPQQHLPYAQKAPVPFHIHVAPQEAESSPQYDQMTQLIAVKLPIDNWFLNEDAKEQLANHEIHQKRPQDSTAPVLFPLGARLPLPKSNFSAAVVNQYQTLASIATPVVSSDFYHLPGEPNALAVADNAQQYYNELDERGGGGPHGAPMQSVQQPFYPNALYYSPKEYTPIIEPPAEGEAGQPKPTAELGKSAFGFVPSPVVRPMPMPVKTLLVPVRPKPQPVSYSQYRGSIDPKPLNLHQYASGYTFGYRVRDVHTGNDFGHTQNRDTDGVTHGEYHILLPDGRIQSVKYMADEKGFHADVRYNGAGGGGGDGAKDNGTTDASGAGPAVAVTASGNVS